MGLAGELFHSRVVSRSKRFMIDFLGLQPDNKKVGDRDDIEPGSFTL